MSDESKKIISAYEQMFKSGEAFKKIDMQKIQNQQYAQADRAVGVNEKQPEPLGTPMVESKLDYDNTDFSAIDEAMKLRMNGLREKLKPSENSEIDKLKKRIKRLEEALVLVMQTQEKLLGD